MAMFNFSKWIWYLSIVIALLIVLQLRNDFGLKILTIITADIYMSKTAIKILKQNVKFVQTFGFPETNLVSWTRRQPHSLDFNYKIISSTT